MYIRDNSEIHVMGIINISLDSFSGDGVSSVSSALEQASDFLRHGADILDIGGESTRPSSEVISESEELARVIPVIESIRESFPCAILSIDTYKSGVALRALEAGASMVNDVTGLCGDDSMASVVAGARVPVVLMDNRAVRGVAASYGAGDYGDVIEDVQISLGVLAERAIASGILRENIILDCGIGFGKSIEQNLRLIKHSARLRELGYPILLGASRKNFIGRVLDNDVSDRLAGSAACAAMAIFRGGADIIRVHDVRFMSDFIKMLLALRDCDDE